MELHPLASLAVVGVDECRLLHWRKREACQEQSQARQTFRRPQWEAALEILAAVVMAHEEVLVRVQVLPVLGQLAKHLLVCARVAAEEDHVSQYCHQYSEG